MIKPSTARRNASSLLANDGNRFLLILASLVVLASTILYVLTDTARYYLTYAFGGDHSAYITNAVIFTALNFLLTLFFILPIGFGLLVIAARIHRGESAVVGDVLFALADKENYKRVLRLSFGALWKLAAFLAVVHLTTRALTWEYSFGTLLLQVLLIGAEAFLFLLLCSRRFFVPFWMLGKGCSYRDAVRMSRAMAKRDHLGATRYVLDYLPWLLLSFLTIGILFFADTLPRMLTSYFEYSQSNYEMITRSEE